MKKFAIAAFVLTGLLCSTAPAFAMSSGMNNPRLKFADDYARAIARFEIDGRPFLVQENPSTVLEIKTKLYWLYNQQNDVLKDELLKTF